MNFLIVDGLLFAGFAHSDALGRRGVYNEDVLACTVAEQPSTHWVYGTTHEEFSL
jgi:hypothetical protein